MRQNQEGPYSVGYKEPSEDFTTHKAQLDLSFEKNKKLVAVQKMNWVETRGYSKHLNEYHQCQRPK